MRFRNLIAGALLVAPLSAFAGGDVAAGKAAFAKCAMCHQVGPGAKNGFGPQLNGVVGVRAGSRTDYPYSQSIKQYGVVWNEEQLSHFLQAPMKTLPGTKMAFPGVADNQERANLIAYLRTFK